VATSVENVAITVRDAVRWGRVLKSPADLADPSKRSATYRPIKAWNIESLRTFLEPTRGDELSPLWMLLATKGFCGELFDDAGLEICSCLQSRR